MRLVEETPAQHERDDEVLEQVRRDEEYARMLQVMTLCTSNFSASEYG